MIFNEQMSLLFLQGASWAKYDPPVRPNQEHGEEDHGQPKLQIRRPSRYGHEEGSEQRDSAYDGTDGGHYLCGYAGEHYRAPFV